jgi:hypothetical protein
MGCCTSGSRVGCLTHNEHFIFVVSHRGLSFGAGMPRNPPNKDRTLVHLTKRNKGLLLAYAYEVLGEVGGQLNDKLNAALTDIWKKFTLPTKVAVPGDSRLENLTRDGLRSLCTVVGIRYERNDKTAGLVTKLQTFRDKERQQQADKRASRKRKRQEDPVEAGEGHPQVLMEQHCKAYPLFPRGNRGGKTVFSTPISTPGRGTRPPKSTCFPQGKWSWPVHCGPQRRRG